MSLSGLSEAELAEASSRIQRVIAGVDGRYLNVSHSTEHRSVDVEDYWLTSLNRVTSTRFAVSPAEARALAAALLRAADGAEAIDQVVVEPPMHVGCGGAVVRDLCERCGLSVGAWVEKP